MLDNITASLTPLANELHAKWQGLLFNLKTGCHDIVQRINNIYRFQISSGGHVTEAIQKLVTGSHSFSCVYCPRWADGVVHNLTKYAVL